MTHDSRHTLIDSLLLRYLIGAGLALTLTLQSVSRADEGDRSRKPLKAVFLCDQEKKTAEQFCAAIKNYRINCRVVRLEDFTEEALADTDLIIVGSDTGAGLESKAIVDMIADSKLPILAMGDGGYKLFGKMSLRIGAPHGEDVEVTTIRPDEEAIFWDGFRPQLVNGRHECFSAGHQISIQLEGSFDGVVPIAAEGERGDHFPVIVQKPFYLFWGFNGSAEQLTRTGKHLFPWACHYTVAMQRNPDRAFDTVSEVERIRKRKQSDSVTE
jgi:hypothetical protein